MTDTSILWNLIVPDTDSNSSYLDITKDGDSFVLINAIETTVVQDNTVMAGISMSREDLEELISKLTSLLT